MALAPSLRKFDSSFGEKRAKEKSNRSVCLVHPRAFAFGTAFGTAFLGFCAQSSQISHFVPFPVSALEATGNSDAVAAIGLRSIGGRAALRFAFLSDEPLPN